MTSRAGVLDGDDDSGDSGSRGCGIVSSAPDRFSFEAEAEEEAGAGKCSSRTVE
jgi:hypothetical protein